MMTEGGYSRYLRPGRTREQIALSQRIAGAAGRSTPPMSDERRDATYRKQAPGRPRTPAQQRRLDKKWRKQLGPKDAA
jgi:hypothetical protein